MKPWKTILTSLAFIPCIISQANGADVRHTFGGSNLNSFYIDNVGGSVDNGGSNNSYFLNFADIDQSAFGTLLLYRNNGSNAVVDDGLIDQDFTEQSGIQLFPLANLDPILDGEIALSGISPLAPVKMQGSSGLTVEQVSYTSHNPGDDFVIVEYRVINSGNEPVEVKLGLSNDFDVDLKSADALAGYDDSVFPLVYQQEGLPIDPNFTTVSAGLMKGGEAEYRIENCSGPYGNCQIFSSDNIRKDFFEGVSGQVGDLTGGATQQDFAVTIAADLGTLEPNEGKVVVFCYALGQGADSASGLNACQDAAQNCQNFYENNLQFCGNGLINFDEQCDDGNNNNHDDCPSGSGASCQLPKCGDGFLWDEGTGTEACDDGNDSVNDSCPSGPTGTCQNAACGDGFLWDTDGGNEQCDNGSANSDIVPDACRTDCSFAHCGDNVTDSGEECDDGNNSNNDACCNCQAAKCGDGFVHTGVEQCDDGNTDSTDSCTNECKTASCGDGFTQPGIGEQCDDGNSSNNDACCNCQAAKCGDGFIQIGVEVCDDGNNNNGDGCAADCKSIETCGNHVVNPPLESCDDGNNSNNDSCPNGPGGTCQPAFCGDGHIFNGPGGSEQCDDGNTTSGDGCSATCQLENTGPSTGGDNTPPTTEPECGNGILEKEAGEQCDDGNLTPYDGCSPDCKLPPILQGGSSEGAVDSAGAGTCALNMAAVNSTHFSWLGMGLGLIGWIRYRRR